MPCIPSARDITSLYPVGIATVDTHRTCIGLKKERKDKLILIETDTPSRSLSQGFERQSNF